MTLGERLFPLFESMQTADQRHCLDVYAALRGRGCEDRAMLQTALLHDAGKGRISGAQLRLWHRVVYVVLEPTPRLLTTAARLNGRLRALHRHGKRTLELTAEYGATADVLDLLAQMEGSQPPDERGSALKALDDES